MFYNFFFGDRCTIRYKNPISEWKFTYPEDVIPFSSFCTIELNYSSSYHILTKSIKEKLCFMTVSWEGCGMAGYSGWLFLW